MRSIDIHAHTFTPTMLRTLDAGQEWYGMRYNDDEKRSIFVREGKVVGIHPKCVYTPEERVADMDRLGTEVQVVAIHTPVFGYHLSPADGLAQAREVNNDIAAFAKEAPTRFAGMATLPMQDVDAAIAELDRAVNTLGLKGAELDTVVNGKTWDEPEFLPFFKAAESMGATLFYHPQPQHNLMLERTRKYSLNNSVGVPVEDTLLVAALIYGGVMENCPDLKVCVAHGGGPACFGMGRMDRGWQVRSEARVNITRPPSYYQSRIYYDIVVMSERSLRFLIDQVGIERVVLGSDYPFVPWDPSPTGWLQGLESVTQEEKDMILWKNLEKLLGIETTGS